MKMTLMRFNCLALLATALTVSAATNHWDTNGATPGFGAAGGTWGLDAYWSADATGASVPAVTDATAADDLIFGSRTAALGSGTISVSGTNQSFRTLTFGHLSGPITLTGGALNLTQPLAKVSVLNVSNTVVTALAGTGGLHKFMPLELSYTNFLTPTATVIYTNASLADYYGASAVMWGSSIARRPAAAYHFVNTGLTNTFQFQAYDDVYTKCVKVELVQAGPDITARAVYAKYVSGNNLGYNFDAGGNTSSVATNATASGYGVAQTYLLPLTRSYEPFVTATPTVAFTNVSLASVRSVSARMGGSSVSDGPAPALPFFFNNSGSTCTVQIQAFNGNYTKCVKLELTQSGPDIAARAVYAKYYNAAGTSILGYDFDAAGTGSTIATAFNNGAYGLCLLRLPLSQTLVLGGTNTYAGATVIDDGVLEIGGAGLLGGGSYSGAVANAGTLLYNSTGSQTLYGNISGGGSLVKESPAKSLTPVTYGSFLTASPVTIFQNTRLADCVGASGVMGGSSVASGAPFPAAAYHFTNDGAAASFQLQIYDGGHTKCVKVVLAQAGAHITGYVTYAKYLLSQNNLGFNFDTGGTVNNIATSYGANGYGAAQTTLSLLTHSVLTLAGTNTYSGGTVVKAGTLKVSGSTVSLPTTGGIIVNRDAELLLSVPGDPGIYGSVGGNNPITVRGGLLTINGMFNAGHARPITIDGGVINSTVTANDDNSNYMNNLSLMNGASVTGHKIRVGYVSVPTITVSGTNACSIPAGINMVKVGENPMTFNIADVTGDAAADLTISGVIRDYTGAQYEYMPIVKTGAGTLSLSGLNTHKGVYTLTQGALALAGNGALNANNNVALNGGTLAMGAVTNTAGTLTMSADSALALGEGRLAFASSTGAVWAAGADLTLTGTLGRYTLRFGTDASALTPAQLAAISYDGGAVRLRPDGYLAESAKGTLILVQ